ncbi:hypothetical protein GGP41_001993 [Bipolaris sorokiniana]|uniref:Uncharacterized protein n=1 Tax=Cochliobolus sativus TaxID=45130 RepID=A0A8H6DYW0_COCSA|nr:hypothetical protein GGP41_001993 [Bipolaris sorokiniana]
MTGGGSRFLVNSEGSVGTSRYVGHLCVTFSGNACNDESVGVLLQSPCFHMNRTSYTEITITSAA